MIPALAITPDPLTSPEIHDLIATHLAQMRAQSPACSVHALDLSGLTGPGMAFWAARLNNELVGCGALKRLSPTEGEIKSMHVRAAHRGKGLARAILGHIEGEARAGGMRRLWLETGSQPEFAAARALYTAFGYAECPPFGDYLPDPNSTFMTREL